MVSVSVELMTRSPWLWAGTAAGGLAGLLLVLTLRVPLMLSNVMPMRVAKLTMLTVGLTVGLMISIVIHLLLTSLLVGSAQVILTSAVNGDAQ